MSETCRVIINQVKQKLHLVGHLPIRYYKDARYHEHKILCKLFGIICIVHSATGIFDTIFSCHVLINTLFISYHHNCHHYFGFLSVKFLFSELCHFISTNYSAIFIA